VVNIVLKHGGRQGGNSVTVGAGRYTRGGGDQNSVSGSVGFDLGQEQQGWLRASWNYLNAQPTNHAETGTQTDARIVQVYGNSGQKTGQLTLNGEYALDDLVTAYGYLGASRRELTNYGYYRAAGASNNVAEVYPDGYLPQMPTESNDFSGVLGLKGSTDSGWYWDLSGVYGINNIANQVDDSINVALYRNTGSSPQYMYVGTWRGSQAGVNLDLSKDFHPTWLPNTLTVAFGASWLHDQFKILAGEPASYYTDSNGRYPGGAQTFFGLTPQSAGSFGRHSQAAYIDLETDLTPRFSVGLAGRAENYSDFGFTKSGKLSGRFRLTDGLSLRGTVSNGFRAPSLGQQYYQTISTIINNNVLTQTGTFRTTNPVAAALGARPLTPEKSSSYSLGAVWTPAPELNVTIDAYQIRISDQILLTDSFSLSANPALAAYVATVSDVQIGAAQYFANAATSRARGLDLVSSYDLKLAAGGSLRLSASANYNKTELLEVAATPAVLQQYAPTVELYGRASQGLLTRSTPRTKYVLSGTWNVDRWSVYGGLTRYGAVTRVGSTAAADQRFDARWLLDTSVSYTAGAWNVTAGANNLTNQYPTRVASSNSFDYYADQLPYSPLSPFGFNGRYLFANVTYRW
ncbi:TonB-dependent receptor, partial [Xanthomonas sp. Kuri4-1]